MRLSELRNTMVYTLDGERLGRVHDVHCMDGLVTALMVGPASFIERLTAKKKGRRVPWDCVRKVEKARIVVVPDPPQREGR